MNIRFRRRRLAAATALLFASAAQTAIAQLSGPPVDTDTGIPVTYVGSRGRIGLGVDDDGHVLGELFGIAGDNGERAFLGEAYFAGAGAGGFKGGYHWLWAGGTRVDSIERPQSVTVAKIFGAWDQNRFHDRKATVGLGFEREGGELGVYYSRALTGARLLGASIDTTVAIRTGEEGGRPFQQAIFTDVLTEQLEHPYEHGLGIRFARFLEQPLLRLRAGLDYERGSAFLGGDHASQTGVSIGLDKYFRGSGHSLALEIGHHRKQGPYDRPEFGGRRERTSANLVWRYDLGNAMRPLQPYRMVENGAPAPAMPQVVRNQVQIASQELFEFDRSELTPAAQTQLLGLLEALTVRRVGTVEVAGHTCDLGSDVYNQDLSERRAATVGDWLRAHGVPADAIVARGLGESQPRHPNDSEANRARNRRIELAFITFEETTSDPPPQSSSWKRETISAPAAWIERALRNLPAHKRTVDTYRAQRVTRTVREGPKSFVNRPPQANDDAISLAENATATIAVLGNDRDPDGDALRVQSATDPAHGQVLVNADGSIAYTPDVDYSGSDGFQYTIGDGRGGSATATVAVTVQPAPNRPPLAVDDAATTAQDIGIDIQVTANDSDPDSDAIELVSVTDAANGVVSVMGNGIVRYAPDAGFAGQDSFQYTIRDPGGASAVANVMVTVQPPNRPPTAANDTRQTFHEVPVNIPVLDNDSDPDGDALAVQSVEDPLHGTASVAADGTVLYVPESGFVGIETFAYTIGDGRGGTASATVTVTVEPPPT